MTFENIRYLFWRHGWVKQHNPSSIGSMLEGFCFSFSSIKFGNIKKKEGDIVIVNLSNEEYPNSNIVDLLGYLIDVDRIITVGIYTNIYFGKKFFSESIYEINK